MPPRLDIVEPRTAADMAAFRQLNWDYRDFLLSLPSPDVDMVLAAYPQARYRAVLDAAETDNRPPNGAMRLLRFDGVPVGCGTIQTVAPGDAEIKRVFVLPAARGTGAGRALMQRLIADCRDLGYRRILMDTGRLLTAAQRLYDDLGFRRRGPYQPMPAAADGIMVYYEMVL